MTTPISSIVWVITGSVIGSLGGVGLKAGATRLRPNLRAIATNWRLAGGLGLYLLSTVFFLIGVAKGELSILYPMVSVGYICTLFWSKLFFGESITRSKVVGLGFILIGVTLLGLAASGRG